MSRKKGEENHKPFCSIYVQSLRLQNLQGISLLEKIDFDNINNKLNAALQAEAIQLQALG